MARLFLDQERRGELDAGALTYTCHAGLQEIAVPLVIDGRFAGCLLAGGFLPREFKLAQANEFIWNEAKLNDRLQKLIEDGLIVKTESGTLRLSRNP